MEIETFQFSWMPEPAPIEFILVPIIAVVVTIYGVLGGLRAAYWTDLIQGIFIILLSVALIPAGLDALAERFGDPQASGVLSGFEVLHERVSDDYFKIVETPRGGEFPLHYIVAITLLGLVGIVVQPHFIAIGGGSAKTEMSARVGLVGGVFMKRLCSVGWALTALIVLALMADNLQIARGCQCPARHVAPEKHQSQRQQRHGTGSDPSIPQSVLLAPPFSRTAQARGTAQQNSYTPPRYFLAVNQRPQEPHAPAMAQAA